MLEDAGSLDPAGWVCNAKGEVVNGYPQSKGVAAATLKHARALRPDDVWRIQVEGGNAEVGFALEGYDPERNEETEGAWMPAWTCKGSIAYVDLFNGMTFIGPDMCLNGVRHYQKERLRHDLPKTKPYDLALRIDKDGNVPQIQFNDDSVWHDFAPDRVALTGGPWFPYLRLLNAAARLTNHRVDRPKPTKSAGKKMSALPATSVAPVHPAVEVGAGSADARAIIASDPAAGGCTSTQSAGMKRKPAAAAAATGDDFEELHAVSEWQ